MISDKTKIIYGKLEILHTFKKNHPKLKYDFDITLQLDSYGSKTSWKDVKKYIYYDKTCSFEIEFMTICNDDGKKYKKTEYYTYKKTKGNILIDSIELLVENQIDSCSLSLLLLS